MQPSQRMNRRLLIKLSILASLSLILVLTLFKAGPNRCLAQQQEPVDVLRVDTNLVVFDAQVIDKKTKRTLGNLTKEDFERG